MKLALDQIRIDGGTQPRIGIDHDVAYDYGDLMADGVKFPPVTVFYDGENYWLADGFHRYKGAYSQDINEIEAEVIQGTLEDAQWYSFGANKAHGLMRSNDDKQQAVKAALAHPKCAGLSDNQIAKHVGVNQSTVSAWRKKLDVSYGIHKMDGEATRTVTRNGKTYEMDTSNIGRALKDNARLYDERQRAVDESPSPEQTQADAKPAPAPEGEEHFTQTQQSEPKESDELTTFAYHLRGLLETQLTDALLAEEIISSSRANQLLFAMEKVYEFLGSVQAHAAASR